MRLTGIYSPSLCVVLQVDLDRSGALAFPCGIGWGFDLRHFNINVVLSLLHHVIDSVDERSDIPRERQPKKLLWCV
jgi:hypothetical protein